MEQLTVKQYLALSHLAAGLSNQEAADAVGVSLSSVEKWKRRKDFQALLRESLRHIHNASIAELCCGAITAAQELRRIISNPDATDKTKIAAIQVLFAQLQNFRSWDVESRIEQLEGRLDAVDEESTATREAFSKTAKATNGHKS